MAQDELLAAFAGLNTAGLDADSGVRWWPDVDANGDVEVLVLGLHVDSTKFTWKSPSPGERPGLKLSFEYQLVSDPGQATPRTFNGVQFLVPTNAQGLPDGQAKRVEIETRRLMGHLQAILGEKPTDLGAALLKAKARIEEKLSAGSGVVVTCRLRKSTDPNTKQVRVDREYLREVGS